MTEADKLFFAANRAGKSGLALRHAISLIWDELSWWQRLRIRYLLWRYKL